MAKAAQTKKAPAKKAAAPAVKPKAASTSFEDEYNTPAFKSAIRANKLKHLKAYNAVNALAVEGKNDILAAINAAHKTAKKKIMQNVDAINSAKPDAATEEAGANDLG